MASESPTSKCSNRVISPYVLESGETNGQNFQIECIESSINYSDNVDHNENQGAVLPEDTMASPLTELLTSRIDRRNFWAPVIIRNSCAKEPPRCNYTTGRQLWSNASRGSVSVGAIVITLNKPQMCSSNVF